MRVSHLSIIGKMDPSNFTEAARKKTSKPCFPSVSMNASNTYLALKVICVYSSRQTNNKGFNYCFI